MTMTTIPENVFPAPKGDALAVAGAKEEQEQASKAIASFRDSPTEPRTFEQCEILARKIHQSGMFGVKSEADAFVRIAAGGSLGIPAMQSLMMIDAIPSDGGVRPALRAKLKMALCLRATGVCVDFYCVETTNKHASYRTFRKGKGTDGESYGAGKLYTYTIEDAGLAGYLKKDSWIKNPAAMLRARASSFLADIVYPDVTNGIISSEEAYDHQTEAVAATEWKTIAPGVSRFDELAAAIEASTGAKVPARPGEGTLDEAFAACGRAKTSGDVTPEQYEDLKKRASAKKAALLKPAEVPPARPSPTPQAPVPPGFDAEGVAKDGAS